LPDVNDGKIYRLQVGSYSAAESTAKIIQDLKACGFNVVRESDGAVHRVIVTDIPSALVYFAALRLGALGITQIWVRE
jgi:cell division septation protein DedD